MSERYDEYLREADGGKPKRKGLLRGMAEEIKRLAKTASTSARKWARAKAEKESQQAKEIQARILQEEERIELQRQRELREYELEQQRIANASEEKKMELELERLEKQRLAMNDIVQAIKDLKEMGIEVDLEVVRRNPAGLFELISQSNAVDKKILESDPEDMAAD